MYVILLEGGASLAEVYAGCARSEATAASFAARCGGTYHRTTLEGIAKIEAEIAREAEYVETLRTGLARRTRGTK